MVFTSDKSGRSQRTKKQVIGIFAVVLAAPLMMASQSPPPSPPTPEVTGTPTPTPTSCSLSPTPIPGGGAPLTSDPCWQLQQLFQSLNNEKALDQVEVTGLQQLLQQDAAGIAAAQTRIQNDQAKIGALSQEISQNKITLSGLLRSEYEGYTPGETLGYAVSAKNISQAMQDINNIQMMFQQSQYLNNQLENQDQQLHQLQTHDQGELASLTSMQAQNQSLMTVLTDQQTQLSADESNAGQASNINQQFNDLAPTTEGLVFPVLESGPFSEDSDLTMPSSLTAAQINHFFQGTALAGLGAAFQEAESKYGVSDYWLVSDAVLESAWGTSPIAIYKHNLFGFGADDANPFVDARTFNSFTAGINYVAQYVATYYLAPQGAYYHGASMRGMNICYATDPDWAVKLVAITQEIPSS